MRIRDVLALVACLAHATPVLAQAIRPVDYLPLGQGYQWQFQRIAGSGPTDLHLEVTDVNVADTGTRYFIGVPLEDLDLGLRLEYATDGRLQLRAVTADLNKLLDGLPLDPSATADVQFTPPVLLGDAMLVPGSALFQTPVDTEFDADLHTDIGQVDVDVHATGMITATWAPAPSPTVTPAGSFSDVVMLTLDISLNFSEDTFDTEGSVNETVTAILARGVGFIDVTAGDTRWQLIRSVVAGVPIGDFPQYEDIVGMAFNVPPVISLHGRALGEASSGSLRLRDIHLKQAIFGKTELNAVLDSPAATGVAVYLKGPSHAKKDGTLQVEMDGKTKILEQKVTFKVNQRLDPTSTTLGLTVKMKKTKIVVPVGIVPVVTGAVRISLDGLVDESAKPGSERKLSSNGRLLLGDVEYQIVAKEKLKVKKDGTRKRSYNFKPIENQDVVAVHAEATSTSAADFTFQKLKPTFFKRDIPKADVSGLTAQVVEP